MPWSALVGVFYDDGIYLALAKSVATGGGYRLQYLPGTPGGVHYPFAYPFFLALIWKLWPSFPANVAAMRAANALFLGTAVALILAHAAPRVRLGTYKRAIVVVLAATAIPMLAVATVLFSEPMFLALAAGAVWAADAARQREGRDAIVRAVAAGLLAGLATLTRSIGITVIGGVLLGFAISRQWRLVVASAVPGVLCLVPWLWWTHVHRGDTDRALAANYGTYGDFLHQGGTGWLSLSSFAEVARPLAAIALPPIPGVVLRVVVGLVALGVLLTGFVVLTRAAPAAGWMLWCYVAIVAVWPYAPDRFVWGVLPWLGLAFALGVARLIAHPRLRIAAGLAAAMVAVGFGLGQVKGFIHHGAVATQVGISETMNDLLPWIRGTDSSAVIAGEDEALIWLYTGRRAVPNYLWTVQGRSSRSLGPDSLHAWLERSGATHVILTGPNSDAAPDIDALLSRRRGYLELVRVWPGQLLAFRIHRGT